MVFTSEVCSATITIHSQKKGIVAGSLQSDYTLFIFSINILLGLIDILSR